MYFADTPVYYFWVWSIIFWWTYAICVLNLFKRPGVAGAVLQSPPLLLHSLINLFIEWSFCLKSSRHCLLQAVRAWEPTFVNNVHPPPCVTCYVSHVRCHVSHLFLFIFDKVVKLVGEGLLSTGPTPSSLLHWLHLLVLPQKQCVSLLIFFSCIKEQGSYQYTE